MYVEIDYGVFLFCIYLPWCILSFSCYCNHSMPFATVFWWINKSV